MTADIWPKKVPLSVVQFGYKCPHYPKLLLYRVLPDMFRNMIKVRGPFWKRTVNIEFQCQKCQGTHIIPLKGA